MAEPRRYNYDVTPEVRSRVIERRVPNFGDGGASIITQGGRAENAALSALGQAFGQFFGNLANLANQAIFGRLARLGESGQRAVDPGDKTR